MVGGRLGGAGAGGIWVEGSVEGDGCSCCRAETGTGGVEVIAPKL